MVVNSGDKYMLIGEYVNKIGEKNRIALPKKFREILGNSLIVTRGYENCMIVVNEKQWNNLLSTFTDKPFTQSPVRDTRRFLIGGACEITLDSQGRFVIPEHLSKFAHLQEDVVFIGLIDWVEIWSRKDWEERLESIKPNAAVIAENLTLQNEK